MFYRINRNIIQLITEYVFVIMMILSTFSLFAHSTNKLVGPIFIAFWHILLLIILFFRIISSVELSKGIKYIIDMKYKKFLIAISLLTLLFIVVNFFRFGFPIKFIVFYFIDPIIISLTIILTKKKMKYINEIWYKFENVVLILSVISIVGWILFLLRVNPNSSFLISWDSVRSVPGQFYLDYASQGAIDHFIIFNHFVRNTGIFIEAPMYSYILSVALLVELFMKKKYCLADLIDWKIELLLFTIFTTASTNGMILSVFALLIKVFMLLSKRKEKLIFSVVSVIFIFLFKVLLGNKSGDIYSSYGIRMNDFYATFKAWLNNPLLGNGIDNIKSISRYMYKYRQLNGNIGSSNGLLTILAFGGIPYFLYFIVPVIKSYKVSKDLAIFSSLSLFLLMFENVQTSVLVIYTFSYVFSMFLIKEKV